LAFLLTIPSAVGLALLGRPIISLIYEWGVFTSTDTEHTAGALAFYAIGLSGYSATKILVPAFYALRDARTPMMISVLSIVTNFVMNWMLVSSLHERGLALSVSTVALLNFALLYSQMRRRLGRIDGRGTATTVGKIILASAIMGVCCWLVKSAFPQSIVGRPGFLAKLATVGATVVTGAVVFYFAARLLRVEELKVATDAIGGRLVRKLRS
jgi:putative peptidoglycan lipid II flippase